MNEEDLGPFPNYCTNVCIVNKKTVDDDSLPEILGVTPFEQHPLICMGDVLSVYYFHSGSLKNSGTVTIWHNRNHAAIRTYATTLSGEWHQSLRLIVSEDEEVGWTENGQLVTGRVAMDINGTEGVYSCGEFFPANAQCAVGF